MRKARDLFRDESGLTTTSMVLSLLICLSLLLTAAQVYRIQSASAEVQDVADAAALSAQNQVAEFMLVARFCDAVVLSLSLTGIAVTGLGIVALCVPATAELSEGLIKAGRTVIQARNDFSDRATKALNKLQKALPYFAAACAASVAKANDEDSRGANYLGVAMLVPSEGTELKASSAKESEELAEDVEEQADGIRDDAKRAEEAAEEANKAKQRAFERDCGANPGRCMYERASRLVGLSGSDNPLYSSIDAWSFSVALDRAKRYYATRAVNDAPASGSVHDQAQSALRKQFYRYMSELLGDAYVIDDDDSFSAYFPLPPRSMDEMRSTKLYTQDAYPITIQTTEETVETEVVSVVDGKQVVQTVTETREQKHYVMHAWSGCPAAVQSASSGSLRMLEGGGFEMCALCEFTSQNMGNIASVTSKVDTGFEYHYCELAKAAKDYQKAREEADPLKKEVKEDVGDLIQELVDAAKEGADKRIEPEPPGRFGTIAFVVNVGSTPAGAGLPGGFVARSGSLGPRAALAGATLVDEGSDEGKTVLNSVLDGLREGGGIAVGAAGMVLDAWSWLVVAYGSGQQALAKALKEGLDGMPLIGASGLGTWASEHLQKAIAAVGLQPAEVGALKAVLVNSGHVAEKGGDQGSSLLAVKKQVIAHPMMSTDLFSSVLTEAERTALAKAADMGDSIQIASIELLGDDGPSIPITIPLPDSAKAFAVSVIQGLFGRIRSVYVETTGVRVWE